jgi:sporulation protein YlmC with PRC-barrel domain
MSLSRSCPSAGVLLALLLAPALSAQGTDPSRLYGRILTTDGDVYEGFIRWAGNEGGWFDILHGDKEIPERNWRDAERLGWEPEPRERRFEIFGIGISLPGGGDEVSRSSQSGVRLGHVSSLEVLGSNRARLLLKSGEEVEFRGGGDIGASVDEILVASPDGQQVELAWRDVRTIDFLTGPEASTGWGDRLYGTLRTRDGERFTGYVVWDMDELFGEDVLDGEDGGREVEIPFARVRSIERYGSGAARVRLADGEDLVLRGSNDVDDDNRDILIADPALGEVRVEWDAFDILELERPPSRVATEGFDGGSRLRGTVRARGGETHTGWIRWDNDEESSWEILDGELADGVDLDIEMGRIQSIERVAYDASRVTLRDGRTFELTGSNDVDEGNKGVFVEREDGALVRVPWDRFERVDFDG